MSKVEKSLLCFIEKHLLVTAFIFVSVLGFVIRFSLRNFVSADATQFLLPWYDEIKTAGGIGGLGAQVGNYNMPYQFMIAIMTCSPFIPLHAYKILSCIFDYCLAAGAAWAVYKYSGGGYKGWKAFTAYLAVLLSPVVFLNSSMWAQCDAIYTFFILMAFIMVCKEQYIGTFIFYGAAVAFKLQAVFFMPFLLFIYFARKKFSVLYFAIIPAVMCFLSVPCLVMGRNIKDIFKVYFQQANEYPQMSMNYPSFWAILSDNTGMEIYMIYKTSAIILTVCLLAGWMSGWIMTQVALNYRNMLYMAFLSAYTCVLFLPAMHERYGYVYEFLGIMIVFENKRTIPLLSLLNLVSLATYGWYLHGKNINMGILAMGNLMIYISYACILMGQILREREMAGLEQEESGE